MVWIPVIGVFLYLPKQSSKWVQIASVIHRCKYLHPIIRKILKKSWWRSTYLSRAHCKLMIPKLLLFFLLPPSRKPWGGDDAKKRLNSQPWGLELCSQLSSSAECFPPSSVQVPQLSPAGISA